MACCEIIGLSLRPGSVAHLAVRQYPKPWTSLHWFGLPLRYRQVLGACLECGIEVLL